MIFYGLKTCDTCRKARKQLDAASVTYEFRDVREDGVPPKDLQRAAKHVGWDKLLNKSSTTWRALDDAEKENLDEKKALLLLAEHPTLMKRPLIVRGATEVYVGWTSDVARALGV